MKNQLFLMMLFCSISQVAYSMSFDLDQASKYKLLEKAKQDNVRRGYWPANVAVTLEKFRKESGTTGCNARYLVGVKGIYTGLVATKSAGTTLIYPAKLAKKTEGYFSKEELESLGVRLPE